MAETTTSGGGVATATSCDESMSALTSSTSDSSVNTSITNHKHEKSIDDDEETTLNDQLAPSVDLGQRVSQGANYLGSIFSSAWSRTTKTASDATNNSTEFIASAINKVAKATVAANNSSNSENNNGSGDNNDNNEGSNESASDETNVAAAANSNNDDANDNENGTGGGNRNKKDGNESNNVGNMADAASAFFSSAVTNLAQNLAPKSTVEGEESTGLIQNVSSAFSMVGKAALDASSVIKDKVGHAPILSDFNNEQQKFIDTNSNAKNHNDEVAPWVGRVDEAELKSAILDLSGDRRNFVRAPPSGLATEINFDPNVANVLLKEDERLGKMRYELVPSIVKEEQFWNNYLYRLNLVLQAADAKANKLKDNEKEANKGVNEGTEKKKKVSQNEDDEFVSEAYQASTKDMAEADESMKKLGVNSTMEDWEDELEGELNEFEVVEGENNGNAEWDTQIEAMLDQQQKEDKKK